MRPPIAALALAAALGAACAAAPPRPPPTGPVGTASAPGWAPRVPSREAQDRAEVDQLLAALARADDAGDARATADLMDWPVLLLSDDRSGERVAASWSRERWLDAMAPLFAPIPGISVTHRPTVFLVSDGLAAVVDEQVVTLDGRQLPARNAMLLVRTGGAWRIKAMVEGGWGDALRGMTAAPEPKNSGR
jgi:hypothetical protein